MINLADDQGRMMDNAALMRSLLFPYDTDITVKDIEKGLSLFVNHHKIVRYAVGTNGSAQHLIQIVNWWRYQKSSQWAGRSRYPAPEKWTDRIRTHGKERSLVTENWDTDGGYLVTTKRQGSGKVVTTSPLSSQEVNNEVNNEVKVVVVVVADAYSLYEERIGKLTSHEKKEIEKLFKINPQFLEQAIVITADHDKHTFAYLRGVFNNLRKGTQKPEPITRGARTAAPARKLDNSKMVRL